MTEKQRQVLQGLVDGKSYAEIAREMDCSRQNVQELARNAIRFRRPCKYYPILRAWMRDNEMTSAVLSQKIGVSQQLLSRGFSGKQAFSIHTLLKISGLTGISVDVLARDVPEKGGVSDD